jgi:hypothetical protein
MTREEIVAHYPLDARRKEYEAKNTEHVAQLRITTHDAEALAAIDSFPRSPD